ncbi:MAG: AAA family ATPase [Myxococcales bacterium]|nr:AAA family ATPase [Myxococcales bacterium]
MPERERERFTFDPFAITPDPAVYVPRAATETARRQLLRSACNPAKTTALIGPPGLGKTLLLHLLAEEAPEEMQTVYLPYAALPPEELCAWTLGLLGLPDADEPIAALQALGRDLRERESSLLMLIDDAGAMPIATARWARELLQDSGGSVRLAVAASDTATVNRTIAAIGSNFDIVHLTDPMTESETRKYIDERLALAGAPVSIRARFDDRTVRFLHRISAGIPRRLHSAAAEILQEAPVATADDHADAPTAPVDAPPESAGSAQTLGAPSDERRVSRRRAPEPEGVSVRVGAAGEPAEKGRRAEDRVEAPPPVSEATAEEIVEFAGEEIVEPAVEDSVGPEPIESEETTDLSVSDREFPTGPALPRHAPFPSRRAIALGSLLVAFVAVAIPVIRSLLSEPRPVAVTELQADPRGSVQGDLREPTPGNFQESKPAGLVDPSEAIEFANELPPAETFRPLAVQINASPWANIEVDGIDLGATPLANIPLFAGEHSFRVRMPDGRVLERTIEIDAERRFISFE